MLHVVDILLPSIVQIIQISIVNNQWRGLSLNYCVLFDRDDVVWWWRWFVHSEESVLRIAISRLLHNAFTVTWRSIAQKVLRINWYSMVCCCVQIYEFSYRFLKNCANWTYALFPKRYIRPVPVILSGRSARNKQFVLIAIQTLRLGSKCINAKIASSGRSTKLPINGSWIWDQSRADVQTSWNASDVAHLGESGYHVVDMFDFNNAVFPRRRWILHIVLWCI